MLSFGDEIKRLIFTKKQNSLQQKQMKFIISSIFSLLWMSVISIAAAFLFTWLLPYCFYSAWWKVAILVIFGTAFFEKIWNSFVPQLSVYPVVFIASKLNSWKSSMVCATIPSIIVGIFCIVNFWVISKDISFGFKDWISAIVWNYIVASCYFHLSLAFISMYNDNK